MDPSVLVSPSSSGRLVYKLNDLGKINVCPGTARIYPTVGDDPQREEFVTKRGKIMEEPKLGDTVKVTYEGDPYYGESGIVTSIRDAVAGFTRADLRYVVELFNNGNKRIFTANEITITRDESPGNDPGGIRGEGLPVADGSVRETTGEMGN